VLEELLALSEDRVARGPTVHPLDGVHDGGTVLAENGPDPQVAGTGDFSGNPHGDHPQLGVLLLRGGLAGLLHGAEAGYAAGLALAGGAETSLLPVRT
jgi:hypothetical protein